LRSLLGGCDHSVPGLQIQIRGADSMRLHRVGIAGLVLLLAPVAGAQTKISGLHKCAKPELMGTAEVGDKAGHTMTLLKHSCPWTTPMEMEGAKSTD